MTVQTRDQVYITKKKEKGEKRNKENKHFVCVDHDKIEWVFMVTKKQNFIKSSDIMEVHTELKRWDQIMIIRANKGTIYSFIYLEVNVVSL